MQSNEDYMDEDGPEFIAMINDMVRHVRSETMAHPSIHQPDDYRFTQLQSSGRSPSLPYEGGSAPRQPKLSRIKVKKGHDKFKQSITTSKNLKKHLESLASTTCDVDQEETFIVIDTNILISHQDHLKGLITDIEQRDSSMTVIVPWVVLEELDLLKSRRDGPRSHVADRAQGAIIFIQNILASKSPALKGQKVSESANTNAYDNDDRILDCCRYFAKRKPHKVILYSNDRNLCNKCMVHHIDSYGSVDQRVFSKLVRDAPLRRQQSSKETLKPSKTSESARSITQTRNNDVVNQVQPIANHSIKTSGYASQLEKTTSFDSKHAVPSRSKRLQQVTGRLEDKIVSRPWNDAVVERHRAKKRQQNGLKQAFTVAYQSSGPPAPTVTAIQYDYDNDMDMDIDDDLPPQGTADSIHASSYGSY